MKVYLYKEYSDDLAYGEEYIRVFTTKEMAIAELKKRVNEEFGCDPKDLEGAYANDEDFVEIEVRGATAHFVVEAHEVEGTENSMTAERDRKSVV